MHTDKLSLRLINMETKMKYYLLNILLALTLGILAAGCSDLKNNIPVTPKLSAHPDGFANPASSSFHGKYIKENNWDLQTCQTCHAADFTGGTTEKSCYSCHTEQNGSLACNTCHGNPNNPARFAPPRTINGDSLTTVVGVGAHTSHLYTDSLSNNVECETCHNVPSSVFSAGHLITRSHAPVELKGLAKANQASNAAYNQNNATCSNTYCHGNFSFYKDSAASENQFAFTSNAMTGNNVTVTWNKVDGTQAPCGSCHDLPPKGHIGYQQLPIDECVVCHQGVVDEAGHIIDKSKHINGKVNVRGN
jgi:hypothetical protein